MIKEIKKPFLRWAGSKQKLIPRLLPYWGKGYRRYIEPFMGSAALFFKLQPPSAILSDINCELVETFIAVRDHPKAVHNNLGRFPLGEKNYYKIRALETNKMTLIERASHFIFLNRFCFNGLYRTNKNGKFNVPFSSYGTGGFPSLLDFYAYSRVLKNAILKNEDFQEILIKEVREGDFVYLDPPYAIENRRVFSQYCPQTFGLNDIERLQETLKTLDKRKVKFALSYALCKEAKSIFVGWNIRQVHTQRNISGFAKHRRRAIELIISNFTCELTN